MLSVAFSSISPSQNATYTGVHTLQPSWTKLGIQRDSASGPSTGRHMLSAFSPAGYYRRKPVSIVAVGMGAPMMDVLVREASYITEGPLAIVRLGIDLDKLFSLC